MRRSTHERLHSLVEGFCIVSFLPHFSGGAGYQIIDPLRSITAIRRATAYLSPRLPLPYHLVAESFEMRLYVELARRDELIDDGCAVLLDPLPGYAPTRSGFVVACGFYVWGVNGVWSLGKLVKAGLVMHLFNILKLDIEETKGALLQADRLRRDFWLWKVCLAAQGVAAMEKQQASAAVDDKDGLLPSLKAWFLKRLRLWSVASAVTEWSGVRDALGRIVWMDKPGDELMTEAWDEALSGLQDFSTVVGHR